MSSALLGENMPTITAQFFSAKDIQPLPIVKLSRSSADIPSKASPVTQQLARTLCNTIPSIAISRKVIGAVRTVPFAVWATPVNCSDCGSIPTR